MFWPQVSENFFTFEHLFLLAKADDVVLFCVVRNAFFASFTSCMHTLILYLVVSLHSVICHKSNEALMMFSSFRGLRSLFQSSLDRKSLEVCKYLMIDDAKIFQVLNVLQYITSESNKQY